MQHSHIHGRQGTMKCAQRVLIPASCRTYSLSMGGSNRSWRWAPLAVALIGSACNWLGGQTGEAASDEAGSGGAPPCSTARPIGYEQPTTQGYTPADVLLRLGGTLQGTITAESPDFWAALSLNDVPPTPVPLTLSVEYFDGAVIENECDRLLLVDVVVTLDLADTLLERSTTATLVGDLQEASLTAQLLAPMGGDGSPEVVSLDVLLLPDGVSGTLAAGTDVAAPTLPFAGTRQ